MVLLIDVWHPDLSQGEVRQLSADFNPASVQSHACKAVLQNPSLRLLIAQLLPIEAVRKIPFVSVAWADTFRDDSL